MILSILTRERLPSIKHKDGVEAQKSKRRLKQQIDFDQKVDKKSKDFNDQVELAPKPELKKSRENCLTLSISALIALTTGH